MEQKKGILGFPHPLGTTPLKDLLGVSIDVVSQIVVRDYPAEERTPTIIACENTRKAVWVTGDARDALVELLNLTERREMTYSEVNERYEVISPGRLTWAKTPAWGE